MADISVIVPVYEVESYITRCIDSILGQSFSDFTLILVDDGSPDNSGVICDEYAKKDNRIHVIHQENGGLSSARNAGIEWCLENSDSQWLTFIDSDDWIHPDYLNVLFQMAKSNGCLISACGFFLTNGEDIPECGQEEVLCLSADEYYCADAYSGFQATACGKLYQMELFYNLRYPIGKIHEDEFTTYQAIYAAGKIAVTSAQMYAYYRNPQSIMHMLWSPKRLHALEAFEEQMSFAKKIGNRRLFEKSCDSYVWSIAHQILQIHNQQERASENKAYLKKMRKELRNILNNGLSDRKYPFNRRNLLLYEVAFPIKPIWDILHFVYSGIRKK